MGFSGKILEWGAIVFSDILYTDFLIYKIGKNKDFKEKYNQIVRDFMEL